VNLFVVARSPFFSSHLLISIPVSNSSFQLADFVDLFACCVLYSPNFDSLLLHVRLYDCNRLILISVNPTPILQPPLFWKFSFSEVVASSMTFIETPHHADVCFGIMCNSEPV
jgi:hypothetical protein